MITLQDSKREGIIADLMPDLTPLLDVMFMLIVFLILTANSVAFSLDIALPKDTENVAVALMDNEVIEVRLYAGNGGWKVGEQHLSDKQAFQQALLAAHQQNPEQKVVIQGEPDTSMQTLLNLLTFLRKQQIPTADILMDKE